MVDRFIEELDDAFRRKLRPLPVNVKDVDELKRRMIEGVDANDKLTDKQKDQIKDNITRYDLAKAAWEMSDYFQPVRVHELSLERMPEEYERRKEEAGRIKTAVLKGRFVETLSRFKTPIRGRTVGEDVAKFFDLSPSTITRDLTSMTKAGYLTRVERGIYQITPAGEDLLKTW